MNGMIAVNGPAAGRGSAVENVTAAVISTRWCNGCWLWLPLLVVAGLLTGCSPCSQLLEPHIIYCPQARHIEELPSAFPPLQREELATAWGKELLVGEALARELDLYRAITACKRGLIFIPARHTARLQQLEYDLFLAYYLGNCYQEAIATFEDSKYLQTVTSDFPAVRELLLALCDSYYRTEQPEKADRVLPLLEALEPDLSKGIQTYELLMLGKPLEAQAKICGHPEIKKITAFVDSYHCERLSVTKAQWLNALLPGAGYYYVGQTKAATTSLVINALFGAAAYQFFKRGEWAAGIITASLELGWYIGGINGAGLAAKQYNECIYETKGKEAMIRAQLFPVLTFETAF